MYHIWGFHKIKKNGLSLLQIFSTPTFDRLKKKEHFRPPAPQKEKLVIKKIITWNASSISDRNLSSRHQERDKFVSRCRRSKLPRDNPSGALQPAEKDRNINFTSSDIFLNVRPLFLYNDHTYGHNLKY